MAVAAVVLFRLLVQHWLARIVPSTVASAGAWVVAAIIVASTVAATVGDLRGQGLSRS